MKKKYTITLDVYSYDKIHRVAKKEDKLLSQVVSDAIIIHLGKYRKKNKETISLNVPYNHSGYLISTCLTYNTDLIEQIKGNRSAFIREAIQEEL